MPWGQAAQDDSCGRPILFQGCAHDELAPKRVFGPIALPINHRVQGPSVTLEVQDVMDKVLLVVLNLNRGWRWHMLPGERIVKERLQEGDM